MGWKLCASRLRALQGFLAAGVAEPGMFPAGGWHLRTGTHLGFLLSKDCCIFPGASQCQTNKLFANGGGKEH